MSLDDPPEQPEQTPPAVTVTRSEEQIRVRFARVPYARVVVRKVVVTEEVTLTVTVRREELRVKRIPVPDAAGALDLPDDEELADVGELDERSVLELVLHAERPVVTLESVPVERVRVRKEIVAGQQQVQAEVRLEHVDVDSSSGGRG